MAEALHRGSPYSREPATAPRFTIGEPVRTRVMNPPTHTRLPRYARGKLGTIGALRGCFVFPDSNAHRGGESPQWCYALHLRGRELWGPEADSTLVVSLDVFEPYLVPL